jgi:hypothetical protein
VKIEIDTDRMCNIKMSWETSEAFAARCGDIRDVEKETAYKEMFDSFRKRPGIQETVEPTEVTITTAESESDKPTLENRKMEVIFRRVNPEVEEDKQAAKIKTRRSQLGSGS